MGFRGECDCGESLTLALGGWGGTDDGTPLRAKESHADCLWCGQRVVDPRLGDVNRLA